MNSWVINDIFMKIYPMKYLLGCFLFTFSFLFTNAQNNTDSTVRYEKVETEASFPGGDAAWVAFLSKTLQPDNAIGAVPKRKKHFTQTAIVKFVVNTDGTLTNISIENDVHPDIAAEAIRVIRKSPRWTPAVQNGKPVRAYRRQPLTFTFE